MKLFRVEKSERTRITLTRAGEKTINITLEDTNCGHALAHVKDLLSNVTINVFTEGSKLQITARDYFGSKPLTSKTISCRGVSVAEAESLILKSLGCEEN